MAGCSEPQHQEGLGSPPLPQHSRRTLAFRPGAFTGLECGDGVKHSETAQLSLHLIYCILKSGVLVGKRQSEHGVGADGSTYMP